MSGHTITMVPLFLYLLVLVATLSGYVAKSTMVHNGQDILGKWYVSTLFASHCTFYLIFSLHAGDGAQGLIYAKHAIYRSAPSPAVPLSFYTHSSVR